MKKYNTIAGIILIVLLISGCKKSYLEKGALGSISETTLSTKAGVDRLLIGAYHMLANGGLYGGKYMFGGIESDDAVIGTFGGAVWGLKFFTFTNDLRHFNDRWVSLYNGIQRANDVLRVLVKVPANDITNDQSTQIKAEARFLRGVFHFEAAIMWRNVPFVDENVSYENGNFNVPNTEPIWPKIEADLQFAVDNLTPTKPDAGRANRWAAKAFLVKVYMFEHKLAEAKPLLDDIITNGVTASGVKYGLCDQYEDNFNPLKKNNLESVFAVQMSVNDGANGALGNTSNGLGYSGPYGASFPTFGWYQPTFSLANSYKTDPVTGLPLIYTWNDSDMKSDQGLLSTDPFTPYAGTVDSRLDWTVSRRGIPYLDWGICPGANWIRAQSIAGPFSNIKCMIPQSQPQFRQTYSKAQNEIMIRFADVLLWAAEVEVEIGSLSKAEEYVNRVRARAANPDGFVHTYIDNNDPLKGFTSTPAANYKVGLYTGQFTQNGKSFARDAVRFERKIELAMESHRFFDLQRYDNGTGYMADVMNSFFAHELSVANYQMEGREQYTPGGTFKKGKNEVFPIPQAQIDVSTTKNGPSLVQNPGY